MKPVRVWVGLVFLAMGALGVLELTGTLDWDQTIDQWWPVAIIGWGIADMLADRRVTLGGTIIAAIGLTLLGDEQGWAIEGLTWTLLFLFIGGAILLGPTARRTRKTTGDRKAAPRAARPLKAVSTRWCPRLRSSRTAGIGAVCAGSRHHHVGPP